MAPLSEARDRVGPHLTDADLTPPCLRAEVEVADGVASIEVPEDLRGARCAWILVRLFGEPIEIVRLPLLGRALGASQLLEAITRECGAALDARARVAGAEWPGPDPTAPMRTHREPAFLSRSRQALPGGTHITVVVCTREQPLGLERCLSSILAQAYPDFSVLVVDNAPLTERTRDLVRRFHSQSVQVRYLLEERRGLSWARNRALEAVGSGLAAWIDDDEVADQNWLTELVGGFYRHPTASAVSGIMLPAELRTWAQIWFEQYGGHHKHRGFQEAVFSPSTAKLQSPLYPLPPFGTGGNMALDVGVLRERGGFSTALGSGTSTLGGEDTRAFSELLLRGGTVVYVPTAITYHYHRQLKRELRRQMFGYGVGLVAFYCDVIASRPASVISLLRLAPRFWRDLFSSRSMRSGGLPRSFPSDLRWANRFGLMAGPGRYLAARLSSIHVAPGRRRARASSSE